MIDFATILKTNPSGVFATQDGHGIQTRVFQHLFAEGSKVYFCTNSEKPVYAQLQANPNVSFCTYPKDFNPVLSINGNVIFVDDAALKARALDENPMIKEVYKSPENPIFKIFYIEVKEVKTFDFVQGPKSYIL